MFKFRYSILVEVDTHVRAGNDRKMQAGIPGPKPSCKSITNIVVLVIIAVCGDSESQVARHVFA